MRRNLVFLVVTLVLVAAAIIGTLAAGHEPILGLDLQGGISVVLSPVGKYKSDALDVAVDVIRNRVDSLGVAEPEISRQGNDIVVDLPGVKDRAKAERLVGQTAELRFRPVIVAVPSESASVSTTTTTKPGATTTSGATTTTAGPTTTTAPASDQAALAVIAKCDTAAIAALTKIPTTPRGQDARGACVVLPLKPGGKNATRYLLGPAGRT